MQDAPKAVRSIPYVSVAFYSSLKQIFIAYRSSSRPDCIFEIHQLLQSGFSRVYSNCHCNCSFEAEIIKIGQSSHKMYSNNIGNFQESATILNSCTKNETWMTSKRSIYMKNLLVAYFLINGRFCLVSLGNSAFSNMFPRAGHVLMTFELWTLCARLCIFSLHISHLLLSSQQTSIAM